MTEPTRRAARLLLTEAEHLPSILRSVDPSILESPTCLPAWSIRDVLAHCSGVLVSANAGVARQFTPEANQVDVDIRRPWPVSDLIDELERSYADGARAIDLADGALDGVGLGEWVHGGDVRDALGLPDAYASPGIADALILLAERSARMSTPSVTCELDDAEPLMLGLATESPTGTYRGSASTLVRLVAGRPLPSSGWSLVGVDPDALRLFT